MADEKLNTGPAENISPEAAEPIATPEQAAASEPRQEQTGPATPEPGDVVVSFDKINELMAEKRQNARAEVEKSEMLANSEFIIMLNQASTDRIELAKLLNISDLQLSYITNVGAGQGLLKVGSSLVPFVNKFPRNTELYKLMTTKFGEV